jgi:hypothetical protein
MACGGDEPAPKAKPAPTEASGQAAAPPAPEPAAAPAERPDGPLPTIMMVQAQFVKGANGKPAPGPAKLVLWRTDGKGNWWDEIIEDESSNVFHKAVPYDDGILTIAAGQKPDRKAPSLPARLTHWTQGDEGWTGNVLWEKGWGGKFNRLRDFEIADFDGDGKDEIAIATHDEGVVAVADRGDDGTWTVAEMDQKADTFVHEVEAGDVDGDGKIEFYVTPSARNKASGESQPGGVARYDFKGGKYVQSEVVYWDESHAKEILVTDTDPENGADELYVVKEGHVVKEGKKIKLVDPVKIIRIDRKDGKIVETEVASIEDRQCRFLVPGDVNHDGKLDLVAAGMQSGLWMLTRKDDGTFKNTLIDDKTGGFEHATHVADLDGDGKLEIYVASDKQRELRSYTWNGKDFDKKVIAKLPKSHITWNLQDGVL